MSRIYLNGRLVDPREARIDPADRGLLLADGLFETLRAYGGKAFCLEAHLARLVAGCGLLGLPAPPAAEMAAAVKAVLAANELGEASIRITLTRGVGPRGLLPPAETRPTLMVAAFPLPPSLPSAMSACVVGIRRNEHSPVSQLKSLAYLDNILALREADAAGCDEAILLNTAGRIAGGSRSNLFLVLDGTVTTPPPSEGLLPGIARQTVLALAKEHGIPAREAALAPAELARASEAFLTNSLLEVLPVTRLQDRTLPEAVRSPQIPGPALSRKRRTVSEAMVFDHYLALWQLAPEGEPIATRSCLLPVRCRDGTAAMLKVAITEEEQQGAALMAGDLHHRNILDFGSRGWLAIDPKGILGERGFDFANIFCNPDPAIATVPGRLAHQSTSWPRRSAWNAAACSNDPWLCRTFRRLTLADGERPSLALAAELAAAAPAATTDQDE